jgi:Na+/H+ antiporter NhaD/arsenite permease-like protein
MPASALAPTIALVVFAASYVGLGLGRLPGFRVDRTGVAIIGGALMVLTGVLPWNDAVLAVDAHTLVLLFGMMIVTAYLRLSGFFSLVTPRARSSGRDGTGLPKPCIDPRRSGKRAA